LGTATKLEHGTHTHKGTGIPEDNGGHCEEHCLGKPERSGDVEQLLRRGNPPAGPALEAGRLLRLRLAMSAAYAVWRQSLIYTEFWDSHLIRARGIPNG